ITVQASGSQKISSVASLPLTDASSSIRVIASGSQWDIIGAYSASYALSSSAATSITFVPATASFANNAANIQYTPTASNAVSASWATGSLSASNATTATSASYASQ